ncbi:hypothetical protein [Aeromicrobium sp.]|uniref:hypothetical protein n=1 Tax=Aeromicrobium sp. TaxID=1871063 RepID=UPI002FCC7B14
MTVLLGLVAAVRGDVLSHRGNMTGSWLGLAGAGIAASAVPERELPQLVVHSPGTAALAVVAVLTTSAAVVALGSRLSRARTVSSSA